jgi:hypothetical protein
VALTLGERSMRVCAAAGVERTTLDASATNARRAHERTADGRLIRCDSS